MLIREEVSGDQNATSIVDHFASANLAWQAENYGINMVDAEWLIQSEKDLSGECASSLR